MERCPALAPSPPSYFLTGYDLRLDDVSIGPDQVVATLEATAPRGTCPGCGTWSEAVHSHYQRTFARAHELAHGFAEMARGRKGQGFDAWLTSVTASEIAELQRFARSLVEARLAVEADLSLEWSNGQTEGQINKLKLLRRSMYGRAKFDLLRQRVLQTA